MQALQRRQVITDDIVPGQIGCAGEALERGRNLIGPIFFDRVIVIEINNADAVNSACIMQAVGLDVEGGAKAGAFGRGGEKNDELARNALE